MRIYRDDDEEEEKEEEQVEEQGEDLLFVHGRLWFEADPLTVNPYEADIFRQPARISWPNSFNNNGHKSFFDYFRLVFSMDMIKTAVRGINSKLTKVSNNEKKLISCGEFVRFIGIRLAMTAEPRRGSIDTYWESKQRKGSIYTPADFGNRFGMTRHRFQEITSCLYFNEELEEEDMENILRQVSNLLPSFFARFF